MEALLYREDTDPTTVSRESWNSTSRDSHNLLWIDLEDPTDEQVATITKEFGFDARAVAAVKQVRGRPMVRIYRDHFVVTVQAINVEDASTSRLHPIEIDIIVGPDGGLSKPFGGLATQVGGQATWSERCDDAELLEVGRAYAQAAAAEGWRGPLNVQLRRPRNVGPVALELNGRFGGGTAARACLGFDDIAEVVNRFLPGAAFPTISAPESDSVQKYLFSYAVPREGVRALQTQGRWSRD